MSLNLISLSIKYLRGCIHNVNSPCMTKRIYKRPIVCGVWEGVAAINPSFTSLTLSLLLSPPTLPLSACVRFTVQCTCCVQHDLSLLLPPPHRSRSLSALSVCSDSEGCNAANRLTHILNCSSVRRQLSLSYYSPLSRSPPPTPVTITYGMSLSLLFQLLISAVFSWCTLIIYFVGSDSYQVLTNFSYPWLLSTLTVYCVRFSFQIHLHHVWNVTGKCSPFPCRKLLYIYLNTYYTACAITE